MEQIYEAAKWDRRTWGVFDKTSRLFFYVGKGKRFCEKKARELNRELEECLNDPILGWVNKDSVFRMSEIVREVFPKSSKEEIYGWLKIAWLKDDTPKKFRNRLLTLKEAHE